MKRSILLVLIVAAVGTAIVLLRRPQPPSLPSPSPSSPQGNPAADPGKGDVVIRTVKGSGTEVRVVKKPDQNTPFRFDDSKPLEPQVRELLGSKDGWEKDKYEAFRSHSDAVIAAVLNILKDPSAGYNRREQGLGLLETLQASSCVPAVLALAQGDADPDFRAECIRTLGAFPKAITSSSIRALYDAARTDDEKYRSIEVLGTLGDAITQPFLENLAKNDPDSLVQQLAERAATKVRIVNSPQEGKEADLVKILREEEHPLQAWALERIVAEKKSDLAHHLREVLEVHRKLPRDKVNPSFEYHLLSGIRDLGKELSPNEKKFLETYSVGHNTALPD